MPRTVRILGTARNARFLPVLTEGVEVWCANSPGTIGVRCKQALAQWTRWFNLHSRQHILSTYPSGWHYYQEKAEGRTVYLQKTYEDLPASAAFPAAAIMRKFAVGGRPNRYFTCSVCWLIAFAILEGFERIELWGFELRDTKPGSAFAWERPCFAYWVEQARLHGLEVFYQEAITALYEKGAMVPGDPAAYTGPLYGYETKAEDPPIDPLAQVAA